MNPTQRLVALAILYDLHKDLPAGQAPYESLFIDLLVFNFHFNLVIIEYYECELLYFRAHQSLFYLT